MTQTDDFITEFTPPEPEFGTAAQLRAHRRRQVALSYRIFAALGWGTLGDGHITARADRILRRRAAGTGATGNRTGRGCNVPGGRPLGNPRLHRQNRGRLGDQPMTAAVLDKVGYQRTWLKLVLPSGPRLMMRINLPLLGVFLNAPAMVADIAGADTPTRRRLPGLANRSRPQGGRPGGGAVDESNLPYRTWHIGPDGLIGWDKHRGCWRSLTDQEIGDSNLLHGYTEMAANRR